MCYDMVIIIGEAEGNATWVLIAILIGVFCHGLMTSEIAEKKGYSALAGFLIGLVLPVIGLIYEAGRTVSEAKQKEHDMRLAQMIADEIGKREKSAIEE